MILFYVYKNKKNEKLFKTKQNQQPNFGKKIDNRF